jgi:hypothetical protein
VANTVIRLVEKFAATKFDDLLEAKENADARASALNYRKDQRLLSRFSATYDQSAWKLPFLSTRSNVCAPKKSRCACTRFAGNVSDR